ncbi:putative transcription factor interactor and regulator CCHC(Zn) family [Helianthus annuus]|nr:putative transcription factor interactor and regulator CCHC(Zn) family [Helianthus annuus]
MAIALLFQSIPEEQILQVGNLKTAKEMWDALKARHLGADRVREARLQTLMSEFEALKMKDSSTMDEFSSQLTRMSSKAASLGSIIEEQRIVKKFLSGLPRRFIHMVASVEQLGDLKTVAFDDVVGRIKAYEERIKDEKLLSDNQGTQTKLMFNNYNASSSSRQTSRDSSKGRGKGSNRGRGGGGRGRNQSGQNRGSQGGSNEEDKQQGKKDYSKVQCFRCDKFGHFLSRCPERKKEKQANLIDAEEIDPSLFMVQDVQEIVYLNEEKVIPKNYENGSEENDLWYLDNGTSNHITGKK